MSASKPLAGLSVIFSCLWLMVACSRPVVDHELQVTMVNLLPVDAGQWQNISGFDVYADGDKLHAVFTAVSDTPGQPKIAYVHSEDSGLHWSSPQEFGQPFNLSVESKAGNDIQIAASGQQILVVLQVTGEIPGMGPLLSLFSADGGQTWHKAANPTATENDQSHVDLAADAQGRFHMVWLDDRDENGYQGVRYAQTEDIGQHWQAQQTIDESSCSCCWNRLLVAKNSKINVLYRDMEPRDMALAQSANAGVNWQRLNTVGGFNWKFEGCPHNGGGLTEAGAGNYHALVWTGAENQVGMYHLQSVDQGITWSAPQPIGAGSGAFHGDIAALDDRHIVSVWDAMGPEGSSVVFANSNDNGVNWLPSRTLSTAGVSAMFPRVLATHEGWLVMWQEQKSRLSKQWLAAVIK